MKTPIIFVLALFAANLHAEPPAPEAVSFATADGGTIHADYYPAGAKAVVLAHGAVFNKDSWAALLPMLASHHISALALDFRGYGLSKAGDRPSNLHLDILAAIRFLHEQKNIQEVSVLGASMGGGAAAEAATHAQSGDISRLILLSPVPINSPENIHSGTTLYIASRDESGATTIAAQYQKTPEPKQLKLLEGNAHAQHIFKTQEKQALIEAIVGFLAE